MDVEPSYVEDLEFTKLIARRPDACLTTAALELSRDVNPQVDFDAVHQWIACVADSVRGEVARAASEWEVMHAFGQCIAEEHGVFGDLNAYEQAESSFLDRVIETKRGIPISLALLYLGVARAAGVDLKDAPAPEHFMVQLQSNEGTIYADPFDHGRLMEEDECLSWMFARTQIPRPAILRLMRPGDPRNIIIRMLNNLKYLYIRHADWDLAWKVQHRLSQLQPASYEQRRDLGVVALRSHRPGKAFDILKACLPSAPKNDREMLEGLINEANGNLVRWN
ncbi:MAG: tetratricopeptide repeat protein [Planctomycetota bacterium]|nr:tetratricopeptide repeat protein [Planctomycetota bacterium]